MGISEPRKAYLREYYKKNASILKAKAKDKYRSDPKVRQRIENYNVTHTEQRRRYLTEYSKINRERLSEYRRDWWLQHKYGMTLVEYNAQLNKQEGLCAICRRPPCGPGKKILVVDHNHSNKKNRELLCNRCNTLLGLAREDIHILEAAIQYLEKHGQPNSGSIEDRMDNSRPQGQVRD